MHHNVFLRTPKHEKKIDDWKLKTWENALQSKYKILLANNTLTLMFFLKTKNK
jgi:hypothetical protein